MATDVVLGGPTLDQRRAKHAWNAITSLASSAGPSSERTYDDAAKEYAREAKKLPVRIMTAGLGQALAFVLAKANKKPKLKQLHEHLTDWIIKKRPLRGKDCDSLINSIVQGDSGFLRRATEEALAYLQWLNRFAEAEGLTEGAEEG